MAAQVMSAFSSDYQTYIAAQTLVRLQRDCIVYGLGKKEKLPAKNSKTFQYTRFDKLNLPASALSEGVTPSQTDVSISTVSCTMDQWGSFVNISDVADLTIKHPVMQEAIGLLAEQASETIDRECIKVLQANTSIYYPGTVTARSGLATTDVMTSTTVRKTVAALRARGARGYSGREMMGLVDPSVEMDLNADTTFVTAAAYANLVALSNGEVGKWIGVRWVVSNLLPTLVRLATPSSAASNSTGTLSNSTTYYFKVAKVDLTTGFEIAVSVEFTQATGGSDDTITITCPTAAGYTFNVYAGSTTGVLYLHSSDNASASTVTVLAIPTSGNTPLVTPASGVTSHYSWILGKEAFAVPELMSLQTFLTPKAASDSDPLVQRRKASWKVMFKAVICNENFLARIESASNY